VLVVYFVASMNLFLIPGIARIGRCHAFRSVRMHCRFQSGKYSSGVGNHGVGHYSLRSVHSSSVENNDEHEDADYFYKSVSAFLFRQGRTWKRLSHLLTMATDDDDKAGTTPTMPANRMKTAADIGTDHGLLAMGLALSGNYTGVIGVDVSDQALTYGALAMLGKIQNKTIGIGDHYSVNPRRFPIEFRLGNGLQALETGEADVICIAGMGVNTMLEILDDKKQSVTANSCMDLERIKCKRLVLQATNSKPRNLILLYDRLQELGWEVRDERIEFLSRRWYITTSFELTTNSCPSERQNCDESDGLFDLVLPGSKIVLLDESDSMRTIFDEYCHHHKQWMTQDHAKRASSRQTVDHRELRWLNYFFDKESGIYSAKAGNRL